MIEAYTDVTRDNGQLLRMTAVMPGSSDQETTYAYGVHLLSSLDGSSNVMNQIERLYNGVGQLVARVSLYSCSS